MEELSVKPHIGFWVEPFTGGFMIELFEKVPDRTFKKKVWPVTKKGSPTGTSPKNPLWFYLALLFVIVCCISPGLESQTRHMVRNAAWDERRGERKECCHICERQTWHAEPSCHSATCTPVDRRPKPDWVAGVSELYIVSDLVLSSSCQAEKSRHTGWFSMGTCGRDEKEQFNPSLKNTHIPRLLQLLCVLGSGRAACINNNNQQARHQERERREMEEGKKTCYKDVCAGRWLK